MRSITPFMPLGYQHNSGLCVWQTEGRRVQIKALLEPFGITRKYTDDWGAYERHLDADKHEVGKRNTQKIERKNLNLRTWIKRLARKTICFLKSELMHDTVIGLLINKVEFGINIFT
ncbi:MAG: IS1 family transposase [Methylovulum sp.]|nr:IS1 family transposase [Methylovulum sp.]